MLPLLELLPAFYYRSRGRLRLREALVGVVPLCWRYPMPAAAERGTVCRLVRHLMRDERADRLGLLRRSRRLAPTTEVKQILRQILPIRHVRIAAPSPRSRSTIVSGR